MSKRQAPTRPDFIKWLLLAGVAALVVLLCAYVLRNYILPHSVMVDRFRYPVAGIDVSKHNGEIDFERVKELLTAPIVFDGRNLYEPVQMAKRGFAYFCIGRKVAAEAEEVAR